MTEIVEFRWAIVRRDLESDHTIDGRMDHVTCTYPDLDETHPAFEIAMREVRNGMVAALKDMKERCLEHGNLV